ncbi:MAG: DUF167 family protein [Gammaproteobacteria bacterium]|nr:DUF167 family protein [Gammaproteobacteria bacterium]MCW8910791.1 DUF167 family protein [Gammaproteobacteria bacterium]MCW9004169.1 DUF167 family protein [Gammaproteobacteria bacterium]MCW9055516.1 DUF167 family protein [Gammaproteobacteria bacterium]
MTDFYQWQKNDLYLRVRIQPKASKDEFAEQLGNAIKIRITAPPVDGKANNHLIAFLAKKFGVAKSKIEIISGKTGRLKQLKIQSPKNLPDFISPVS